MKKSGLIDFLWSYLFILVQLVYLFVEPLIFTTIGLIFHVGWPYYLISIGGYYALTVLWELLARLLRSENGKIFHPPFVRKAKKLLAMFQENGQPAPTEDN